MLGCRLLALGRHIADCGSQLSNYLFHDLLQESSRQRGLIRLAVSATFGELPSGVDAEVAWSFRSLEVILPIVVLEIAQQDLLRDALPDQSTGVVQLLH